MHFFENFGSLKSIGGSCHEPSPAFLLIILIGALGSCGGPATSKTTDTNMGYEFRRLCSLLASTKGKISREQFLAAAKYKEAANRLFDACDVNQDNLITQSKAQSNAIYFENLKSQVILFHTPQE